MSAAMMDSTAAPPAAGRQNLLADFLASIVVFLVAVPLCMGIAIASGVPPAAGLITGIVGGIAVGAIAGSPLLVSGPAAGLAVLVFELVQAHGIIALGPVVLLSGLIQVAAGLTGLGMWFRMVSPAVVNGMLAGIGILIIASQFHVMFDAKPLPTGFQNFLAAPKLVFNSISNGAGLQAALLGLGTIAMILLWEKLRPAKLKLLPGVLIAIILATVVAEAMQLSVNRVTLPDNLIAGIEWVTPEKMLGLFGKPALLVAALAFAFIASAETLLSAAAVDRMHDGPRTQYSRELTAQGIGNTLCGLMGALPMTGVIVRSAANVQAGATSRRSTIMHGTWILAFVLLLPWLLRMAPISALAGILVFTGFKMIKPSQIKELAEYGRGNVSVYVVTALTIVATDLLTGVIVGIGFALLRLSLRSARLHLNLKNGEAPNEKTLRMVGFATFLNIPWITKILDEIPPGTKLTLDIDRLRHIDYAVVVLLQDWGRMAPVSGSELIVDWPTLKSRSEGIDERRELVQVSS
ncbi:MAG TPA: SulP family inorganic anion transporter [Nevskia sp.]|nr:SulP family inorganic anion transporter [Nevskia sp.]HET7798148.1 SulP family inorganic anion transporter [Nevskia sp.]